MRISFEGDPSTAVREVAIPAAVRRWRGIIGAVLPGLIGIGIAVQSDIPGGSNDAAPRSSSHKTLAPESIGHFAAEGRPMQEPEVLLAGVALPIDRNVAEVSPDLEVVGLIVRGSAGMAIIAEAGGRQKVYRIGDAVRGGMVLQEVSRSGAVLGAGNRHQWLTLKNTFAIKNRELANNPSSLRPDPEAIATSTLRVGPASSRGLLQGRPESPSQGPFVRNANDEFQLERAKPGSVYARLGLRAGDVLRSVNGNPVDSSERIMALNQQLRDGNKGEIEVVRQGRLERLRYGGR